VHTRVTRCRRGAYYAPMGADAVPNAGACIAPMRADAGPMWCCNRLITALTALVRAVAGRFLVVSLSERWPLLLRNEPKRRLLLSADGHGRADRIVSLPHKRLALIRRTERQG
jgi:hypothetical protein